MLKFISKELELTNEQKSTKLQNVTNINKTVLDSDL